MDKKRILIVDDEENVRYSFKKLFRGPDVDIIEAFNGLEAISVLKKEAVDLVLMDIEMPGMNGIDAIQRIKVLYPSLPVIIITAFGTTERVIAAMKYGAYEYLEKPFDIKRLQLIVKEALEAKEFSENEPLVIAKPISSTAETIVGTSSAIKEVYKMIGRVAASDVSVLISGESGTGKELIAKAIHRYSDRADQPFVAINCAAIPDNLLESELFGFEKGAFTDASHSKAGKFEQANNGTLFLDEIADMSFTLQAKLLRVLQDGTFERLGSNKTVSTKVRIISATNKNLESAISRHQFREDLYYRLKVITITIPPLRMRSEDIPLLAEHFISRYSMEMKKPAVILPSETMDILMNYSWPGNVRELENLLKRAVLLSKNNVITPDSIELELKNTIPSSILNTSDENKLIPLNMSDFEGNLYKFVIEKIEKELIVKALTYCNGNQAKTARLLGISRAMLYERMVKFSLSHNDQES
ncbi:MAG: two-component system response regulator [Bacteroidetes bacterium HGW-Bacteroidetes-1]|jgi:DNA-binding NtrC family response regulator|nr:MAG: two-component system response regulator [Bacteroidetes bacterium HGW-Bacteroidetes-1]